MPALDSIYPDDDDDHLEYVRATVDVSEYTADELHSNFVVGWATPMQSYQGQRLQLLRRSTYDSRIGGYVDYYVGDWSWDARWLKDIVELNPRDAEEEEDEEE